MSRPVTFDLSAYTECNRPRNGRFLTIAVDGRGGSGKSALAQYLKRLATGMVVLDGDDYFEPIQHPILWGDFNETRFNEDVIRPLKHSSSFSYRPYDWHEQPHVVEKPMSINNALLIERCYSFSLELDWDLKIWVETPREICLQRGLSRSTMPTAQTAWDVWQCREDAYIAAHHPKELADVVVDGTVPFNTQIF